MHAAPPSERAIDDLRKKFGSAAVIRGIVYDGPEKPAETLEFVMIACPPSTLPLRRSKCDARTAGRDEWRGGALAIYRLDPSRRT
jgi:hypothetical protein